ncbi:hypothetical protein GCM10028771_19400 [Nocardioides marmoraquaticus]
MRAPSARRLREREVTGRALRGSLRSHLREREGWLRWHLREREGSLRSHLRDRRDGSGREQRRAAP